MDKDRSEKEDKKRKGIGESMCRGPLRCSKHTLVNVHFGGGWRRLQQRYKVRTQSGGDVGNSMSVTVSGQSRRYGDGAAQTAHVGEYGKTQGIDLP